uniref:TrbC/VirB2 family protein n=2 Tax=Paracidobacterium acidisoli TaxID=2303751 RepID=A0A372IN78_9BACT
MLFIVGMKGCVPPCTGHLSWLQRAFRRVCRTCIPPTKSAIPKPRFLAYLHHSTNTESGHSTVHHPRRTPMESTRPSKRSRVLKWARIRYLTPLLLLSALQVYAQSTGSDPWDNAVNVLKTAFTGTIATGLSLVAIVVGGLMFAYGEGQSKKMLAGIVFGVGMAIGAVNFMSWLFPS